MDDAIVTASPRSTRSRALTLVLFAIYALLLIGLVLFKFPFRYDAAAAGRVLNLIPFAGSFTATGTFRLSEVVDNVAIFVPFGVYLSLLTGEWSFGKKLVPIIATTIGFETIQYIFAIGRSDITDVIDNVLGGIIGVGIYAASARIWGTKADRIVNTAGVVLTAGVLMVSALLLANTLGGR